MRCTECGARYHNPSTRCPECGAPQNEISTGFPPQTELVQATITEPTAPVTTTPQTATIPKRSLIEFPGVNRNAVPEWRREVGERVRERHEKRSRESVLDATEVTDVMNDPNSQTAPVLELLPQAEHAPVNPIVAAALRRIERANSQPAIGGALATAIAYEEPTLEIETIPTIATNLEVARPERVHNLAVVPPLEIEAPEPEVAEIPVERKKPRKVIDELHCSSLNYLDSITTAVTLEVRNYESASLFRRMFSGITDLIVIALVSSPFAGLVTQTSFAWADPRVVAFLASVFLLVGFLYLTISTALTGRTLGMKVFSLRVVDARTGLIPTGSQSGGRSIIFMLSMATAGLAMLYALVNREGQTMHDRFTRTAVIRN